MKSEKANLNSGSNENRNLRKFIESAGWRKTVDTPWGRETFFS